MNIRFVLFFLFYVLAFCYINAQTNSLTDFSLHGKVKSVTFQIFSPENTSEPFCEGVAWDSYQISHGSEIHFDSLGRVVKTKHVSPYNKCFRWIHNFYDDRHLQSVIKVDCMGDTIYRSISVLNKETGVERVDICDYEFDSQIFFEIEYNTKGQKVKWVQFNKKNELVGWSEFNYDQFGFLNHEIDYKKDSVVFLNKSYINRMDGKPLAILYKDYVDSLYYGDNGWLTKKATFLNTTLLRYVVFTNDSFGNQKRIARYNSDHKCVYEDIKEFSEYDEHGNWLKVLVSISGGDGAFFPMYRVFREIEYFK